jgi:MscS family membrane protein
MHFLGAPLLIRVYFQRFTGLVLVAGLAWLLFRLINLWGERARARALEDSGYSSGSLFLLGQRVLKVLVVVVAVLTMLSLFGFDMTTVLAGLGIGSIAVAFAAQKTLENLIGGISILGDEVISVGESCIIAGKEGVVEDISLRSTRLRMVDRTVLSVPNGQLANMNIENISRRDKRLFQARIGLRYETSPDQLRALLTEIRTLLLNHPKVDRQVARARFVAVAESSLDIDVTALILTRDPNEFLAIREELLLGIVELTGAAGAEFAVRRTQAA